MIRQYLAQRHQIEQTPRGPMRVGTLRVGEIYRPHNCRSNVQILAWIPRDYSTYGRDPVTGRRRFETKRIAGGHLALVRNLANGKTFAISDAWLLDAPQIH